MDPETDPVRADSEGGQPLRARLQKRIGTQKYNVWFRHGTRIHVQDGHVKVSVPNPFVANWIEGHYQGEIAAAASESAGWAPVVVITVDPALAREVKTHDLDRQAEIVTKATQGGAPRAGVARAVPLRHRLEDFVVGQSNKLAYSAALAVCNAPRPPFNPLFVHGPCGVGKTHLLQGICETLSRRRRDGTALSWRYVTAEQFTNEFLVTLRKGKVPEFRQRYRPLDLLAIDDVHFLAAKTATQGEFLHTFNAIESAGRQIVMASDAHPHLVGRMNDQLISRFVAGMVVKIDVPDRPMRLAVVRRKAKSMKLQADPDVLAYIADHVRGSVRELEGTLVKLSALSALENRPVTLASASRVLADLLARADGVLTLGDIEALVAAFFGVTPADIHSSRRTRLISTARMVSACLARRHTSMSYPEIGRHMGKNHSSVVLAVKRMESLLAKRGQVTWRTPAGSKSMEARKLIELLSEQFA